eukprot:4554346-Prymnesium_polylepis.1
MRRAPSVAPALARSAHSAWRAVEFDLCARALLPVVPNRVRRRRGLHVALITHPRPGQLRRAHSSADAVSRS